MGLGAGIMILRPASEEDSEILAELGRDSFVAAFGDLYRPEDLASFLQSERTTARYAEQIADPGVRVYLIEDEGRAVAYALIKMGKGFDERPAPKPERPVLLSQLYCRGGYPGRGLGAQLLDRISADARDWGADAIQLSVYSENHRAQAFYRRYGFEHVADIDFWVGDHRDDEFLYECALG